MKETVQAINLEDLHPFPDHPFQVVDNEELQALTESIQEYGVITPVVVRPQETGGYEIISGHRRIKACEKVGIDTVPAFVRDMDRDAAIIALVDSNLHREHILPSEKAHAYKLKLEAIKRQGKRTDLADTSTCRQLVDKSKSADIVGLQTEESGRQVQRYIRLTELIPPILEWWIAA